MLVPMPAEQVEQIRSQIPERTLRVYEALKADGGK